MSKIINFIQYYTQNVHIMKYVAFLENTIKIIYALIAPLKIIGGTAWRPSWSSKILVSALSKENDD